MILPIDAAQFALDTRLHQAIWNHDLHGCRGALDDGAEPNAETHLLSWDNTPLLRAIFGGFAEGVLLLIERGASISPKNIWNSPALEAAAGLGRTDMCLTLIAAGATIDEAGKNGNTPLMSAAGSASLNVCRLLIEHGAYVHACNNLGESSMVLAARSVSGDAPDVLRLLLHAGASKAPPDHLRSSSFTAFHWAVAANAMANVALFIDEYGEDPSQKTVDGRTMLDLCNEDETRQLLLAAITERSTRRNLDEILHVKTDAPGSHGTPTRRPQCPNFARI
jgi:ankyrin repeat protein